MAAFEGSAKSQLQGVSQQVARERLDGQVTAQDNMLSDVVTGLRRRPGAQTVLTTSTTADRDHMCGWSTDIGGQKVNLLCNGTAGLLNIFDENWNFQQQISNIYLIGPRANLRATTVGDEFIIANVGNKPSVLGIQSGLQDPQFTGYFYVKTGAFNQTYKVDLGFHGVDVQHEATYSTPDGTHPGDAALATPDYIASQLAINILTVVDPGHVVYTNVDVYGAYVFLRCSGAPFRVSTPMPSSYIGTSGGSYVQVAGDLPAKLHSSANGMVMAVGDVNRPTYFKYDSQRLAWVEVGNYGSPGALANMPVRLSYNTTTSTWELKQDYEGRYAGDDVTSPLPNFLTRGITGVGAFQGRLVLLSGSLVNMSASGLPQRFFRSTVTSVLQSDPIEVGASANSSAAYQYCVPFQKDLLLFAEKYQALVPGGNQPVTPQTASVIVTSTYEADMSCSPIPTGRTLMYAAPRSKDFYGVLEMVPSQYTDSQYLSSDVTSHLPKYLAGRCRFAVSSSVANISMFASDRDYRTLIVHEYLWDADSKVQQAWHRWTFPFDIADAFFSGSNIYLVFLQNGNITIGAIDPRIGTLTAQADRRPYLDLYSDATVVDGVVAVPDALKNLDANVYLTAKLSDKDATLMGEEVGIDARAPTQLTTVPSFQNGPVTIGIPYRSSFSPTPPIVKDSNGVVISSNKLTILRYMVGTANTAEYEAIVADASTDGEDDTQTLPALYWGSEDLDLGKPRVNKESVAVLPCRTNANTTTLVLFTEGLGEMNILSLEYVCRYNQKLRRR